MKILHLNPGNLYGGVETVLTTFAQYPGDMEHHFALCFQGRFSQQLEALKMPVTQLGEVRTRNPFSIRRARLALQRLVEDKPFDCVLSHQIWTQSLLAPVVADKLPLGFWMHGTVNNGHWLEYLARLTPPDFIIANSGHTAGTCAAVWPKLTPIVLRYPVPANKPACERQTLRNTLGATDSDVVILQVSRMERWKGHATLLKSLALLPPGLPWKCWMVGGAQRSQEAQYQQGLKDLCERLHIAERVSFLDERKDIPSVMAAADVFCQVNSRPEPFGIVYVEALYAGLPVVSANCGGALDIVDSECGSLVPSNDPGALAIVLRHWIQDAAARDRVKAYGPKRAALLCEPAAQMRELRNFLQRQLGV